MGKLPKIIIAAAGVAALALGAVLVAVGSGGGGGGEAPSPAASVPGKTRIVLVSSGREPAPSPPGPTLHVLDLKGSVPGGPVAATVLSDENCEPDAQGVSHCVNRLRLAGGGTLVVRHPHRMMEVPCLEPGEHVMVRPA
jgi:hypothetical protein